MPDKTIIFHIGCSKSGSSAIQAMLEIYANQLRKSEFLIPPTNLKEGSKVSGQQISYFENLFQNRGVGAADFLAQCDEWFENNEGAHTIIFSAENLSNDYVDASVFLPLKDKYDIQVILYIRRQDDFLISAWQQWYCKTNPDFWSWCLKQIPNQANWQKPIENWEQLVGENNLNVRIFEREKLKNGDVVDDFLNLVGLGDFEYVKVEQKINPSYNLGVQELVNSIRHSINDIHDNTVYEMISALTDERHLKTSADNMLSHAQRLAILSQYQKCNQWVKARYFPDLKDTDALFAEIQPNEATSATEIQRQKEAVIFDLIYQIYKKFPNN